MKTRYTKREITLAVIAALSTLLFIIVGVYALNLRTENQQNKATMAAEDKILQQKDTDSNETANYTETICAEYRKLYQAYTNLRSQTPAVAESYALPGSAKGQIDECYQP